MEWVVLIGMAIALYIIIYKYEKKMDKLHEMIEENKNNINQNKNYIDKNKNKLNEHHDRISENKEKLDEHYNHIENMWVTLPKEKDEENNTP